MDSHSVCQQYPAQNEYCRLKKYADDVMRSPPQREVTARDETRDRDNPCREKGISLTGLRWHRRYEQEQSYAPEHDCNAFQRNPADRKLVLHSLTYGGIGSWQFPKPAVGPAGSWLLPRPSTHEGVVQRLARADRFSKIHSSGIARRPFGGKRP